MGQVAILVAGFGCVQVGESFETAVTAGGIAGEAACWTDGAYAGVVVWIV